MLGNDVHKIIPNALTLLRIFLVPVFIGCYLQGKLELLLPIFALAAFTDWLDGFLARRWEAHTDFGEFCDPVADKLLVCTCLVILVDAYHNWVIILCALTIIAREITMSALRDWFSNRVVGHDMAVSFLGKLKTAVQLAATAVLLSSFNLATFQGTLVCAGTALLVCATVLTALSLIQYLYICCNTS